MEIFNTSVRDLLEWLESAAARMETRAGSKLRDHFDHLAVKQKQSLYKFICKSKYRMEQNTEQRISELLTKTQLMTASSRKTRTAYQKKGKEPLVVRNDKITPLNNEDDNDSLNDGESLISVPTSEDMEEFMEQIGKEIGNKGEGTVIVELNGTNTQVQEAESYIIMEPIQLDQRDNVNLPMRAEIQRDEDSFSIIIPEATETATSPVIIGTGNEGRKTNTSGKTESRAWKRGRDLYCIEFSMANKRFRKEDNSSHIVEWNTPRQTGFGIKITGTKYRKGLANEVILGSEYDYAPIKGIYDNENGAYVVLGKDEARLHLIKDCEARGLSAMNATYRYPIIKFWIYNGNKGTKTWEEIVEEIKKLNFKRFERQEFSLVDQYTPHASKYTLMQIQVESSIRSYLQQQLNGYIFYGHNIQVSDHFNIRKCFNCGSLRHSRCFTKQAVCVNCSGPHSRSECKEKRLKCPNCSGEHNAFSVECEAMKEAIASDMNRIDYVYNKIMVGRSF